MIKLDEQQAKAFAIAIGVWLVLSGTAFYLLGKKHGSKVDCSVEESTFEPCCLPSR